MIYRKKIWRSYFRHALARFLDHSWLYLLLWGPYLSSVLANLKHTFLSKWDKTHGPCIILFAKLTFLFSSTTDLLPFGQKELDFLCYIYHWHLILIKIKPLFWCWWMNLVLNQFGARQYQLSPLISTRYVLVKSFTIIHLSV